MPLVYRRSVPLGRGLRANVSRRGVSMSKRLGRVTVSTTGRLSVRLLKGLSWRTRL